MGQLFFKKQFQVAIREGRKHTTIRRWNRPMVRAGERAYSPGLGWLKIDAVEVVAIDDLCEADAVADGFDTLTALRCVLVELYPEHEGDGKKWYRVAFEPCQKID